MNVMINECIKGDKCMFKPVYNQKKPQTYKLFNFLLLLHCFKNFSTEQRGEDENPVTAALGPLNQLLHVVSVLSDVYEAPCQNSGIMRNT